VGKKVKTTTTNNLTKSTKFVSGLDLASDLSTVAFAKEEATVG
jgi:hypothetical protein